MDSFKINSECYNNKESVCDEMTTITSKSNDAIFYIGKMKVLEEQLKVAKEVECSMFVVCFPSIVCANLHLLMVYI